MVAQLFVQLYILQMHKEPRAIGTHKSSALKLLIKGKDWQMPRSVCQLTTPGLVDNTRAQCSVICCQYPREAKLLFPFPESASYILLSETGEARVCRFDGVSI